MKEKIGDEMPVYVCDGKGSTGKLPTFMRRSIPKKYLKEYKEDALEAEKVLA